MEAVLAAFPALAFDQLVARAHDRLVATTAVSAGWGVATANIDHFDRIPGLDQYGPNRVAKRLLARLDRRARRHGEAQTRVAGGSLMAKRQ